MHSSEAQKLYNTYDTNYFETNSQYKSLDGIIKFKSKFGITLPSSPLFLSLQHLERSASTLKIIGEIN